MTLAQATLGAYLALKKANVAAGLMIPLLVFQILFHIFIRQRHLKVAARLPMEDSLQLDEEGPTDFSFCKDKYKQPALKVKVLEPEYPPTRSGSGCEESNDNEVENKKRDKSLIQPIQNTDAEW